MTDETETIRVQRVEGRNYPDTRPGRDFVGLRRYREKADQPSDIVFRMASGPAFVDDGPQVLTATRELRKAIAKGDLAIAVEDPPPPPEPAPRQKRARKAKAVSVPTEDQESPASAPAEEKG